MTKYDYICYECGHKFETESEQPPSEDPPVCPACHSPNITVYALHSIVEEPVPAGPAGGCDPSSAFT
jgi:putative FmdB family regulatory protein